MTASWPQGPLPIEADLYLGAWTPITPYVYQRSPMTITRGRPDESAQVNPSQLNMTLNNRDGRFTINNPLGAYYGSIGRNTPVRVSVPASLAGGGTYLRMEDDTTSCASCPSASALNVTGDLDVRVDVALSGYGFRVLASKWNGNPTGTSQSWILILTGAGLLELFWSTTGTDTQVLTSTMPIPIGRQVLRATLDVNNGAGGCTATWYTAPAGGIDGSTWTQLGPAVTQSGTTTVFASTAPVAVGNYGAPAVPAPNGIAGAVYDFELRNGIGGSIVTHPAFSSQTAGATSWTDAQGHAWSVSGTAELSGRLYRYHGEMAAYPKAADPSGHDVYSQAQASGILRRLQQAQTPINSPLYRAYTRMSGSGAPIAYWPCEDGTQATQIASAVGGPAMSVNGPAQYAASSDFVGSDALPTVNGSTWVGSAPLAGAGTASVMSFLIYEEAGAIPNETLICQLQTSGTVATLTLGYASANSFALGCYDSSGNYLDSFVSPATLGIDGVPSLIGLYIEQNGAGLQYGFSVTPQSPGGEQWAYSDTLASGTIGRITAAIVNPQGASGLNDVVVGHIALSNQWGSSPWQNLSTLGQPLNAWWGEAAGDRVARLCSEEGIACRIVGHPDLSAAMGNQTIQTLPDLLQECETTDRGMLFEPRTCLGLGYVTLSALYNQTASAVADYSQAELAAAFASTSDDQLTINDVTVSNADGSSARQQLLTGAMSVQSPPAGVGRVDTQITVNAATDQVLASLANWALWVSTVNDDRYPTIPFDMARSETPNTIPLLDVGAYLQVLNPPAWLPPGTIRQLVAGTTEAMGPAGLWTIGINAIPESPYEVAIADPSPATADGAIRADTDGSTLTSSITATATGMSVTTVAGAPIWTTSSSDLPFDVMCGGERMTVTAISGSSSPQTFTVTRSVNGVVKAQTAGTSIVLFQTPIASL